MVPFSLNGDSRDALPCLVGVMKGEGLVPEDAGER